MDSVDPMQVDPQDTCFTAKSAIGGLDTDYPDAENPGNVKRIVTSTGARIRAEMNRGGLGVEQKEKAGQAVPSRLSFDGFLKATDTKEEAEGDNVKGWSGGDVGCLGGGSGHGNRSDGEVAVGSVGLADDAEDVVKRETKDDMQIMPRVKEEVAAESCIGCGNGDIKRKVMDLGLVADAKVVVKKEDEDGTHTLPQVKKEVKIDVESDFGCVNGDKRWEDTGLGNGVINAMTINWAKPVVKQEREELKPWYIDQKACVPKKMRTEESNRKVPIRDGVEDGDFAVEPDWYLVGQSVVTGLSTVKGNKLLDKEIVHFSFPSENMSYKSNANWIVRFSTKRYGEIGRLPMDWGKCVVPLVNSSKVKVLGRCIAAPGFLHITQEILLYVSFYIHHTVFTQTNKSLRIDSPSSISTTLHPLLRLFSLLDNSPLKEAIFLPEKITYWKDSLNTDGNREHPLSTVPLALAQSRKNCQMYIEGSQDDQAISESSLNSIVGAKDAYDLEEMEPPSTLMCDLRPYQKQALYWMSEAEKQNDVQKAEESLHPCWSEYRICDERASSIYVNIFSGEATTQFQGASQMARGGILADAMGLGKTVMTIALILARPGKGTPNDSYNDDAKRRRIESNGRRRAKGGTLIVCPMALLGQWKDELDTHSRPESISGIVHYGGERTNDPRAISEHDVVLTTYGVLASSFKNDGEESIYQRVEWHRVVLDEAHAIKSWKTQNARAAFTLTAYCRWCLTGTPIQNNLQDLYSLFCFLQVEPWCNWGWWSKYIQQPYDSGDSRGLMRVKAILRPLMLRRTKETKDKDGRPILVLPLTDIRIIECEQSEAEQDFYDALFRRSKVQFDQFVAQGKVLHNYASILELLLRLRQCCNHPYLVMSRGDSQQYTDLDKLARRFLETRADLSSSNQIVPSKAFVEEVVEGLRCGDNKECPICLESADDPILTPCAHRMCRECLLSSWRKPSFGSCPLCRNMVQKSDLITCPLESCFRVDIDNDWKESSKVSKLLECLERVCKSGRRQKSIVFSQWTSFLDLLEIPLRRRKIGYLRFDGKLSQKQRERVLREFSETDEKMVLLMSLKAGGVGLNLTAASNVFLMDPWWNPAVEEQAIMRIHRIGQKQNVRVRRFIVKGTVEERLQQVQARKQRMIAGALTDEEVRSARIEELKMLFR